MYSHLPLFSVLFSTGLVTCCQPQSKLLNENFRIKQFLSFKLCAVLRSVIKSHSVPLSTLSHLGCDSPLCLAYPHGVSYTLLCHLGTLLVLINVILLNKAPKARIMILAIQIFSYCANLSVKLYKK